MTSRLKAVRLANREAAKGWTLRAIAAELGVTAPTVANWEEDPSRIPTGKVADVARVYGCAVEDVLAAASEGKGE